MTNQQVAHLKMGVKKCSRCQRTLSLENFYRDSRPHKSSTGRQSACRDCYNEYWKKDREINPEKYKKIANRSRDKNQAIRIQIINAYGGRCVCCGEDQWQFLTVDHIDGGGHKHRKAIGKEGGTEFYKWIVANNFPKGFQLLCYNCNCAKRDKKECPHTSNLAKMGKFQEKHLLRIKNKFIKDVDSKYRTGQARHGGYLPKKKNLLDEAINEVVDLAVYLLTLKEQNETPSK